MIEIRHKTSGVVLQLVEAETLRGANLSGAGLHGADLCRAGLSDADLHGANLSDANLSDADLSDANLSDANLRRADLSGADIDFSCWPLWCGSFDVKVDKRIVCQLAYHFCKLDCDDPEVIAAQNDLTLLANQSHIIEKHDIEKL